MMYAEPFYPFQMVYEIKTSNYLLHLLCSYHEGLKKWVEVGNSGMFRPEMLQPMGLPEDVSVIAWGLSLERYEYLRYYEVTGYFLSAARLDVAVVIIWILPCF